MFVESVRLRSSVPKDQLFGEQFAWVQPGTWPARGAALLAPLLATLVLQSVGCFYRWIERRPFLAQIAVQQSLLIGSCKAGRLREGCKGARGTRALICAHYDVWAVGLALTVMFVFFSFFWSDFCEEQVRFHACNQLMHKLDREVDMGVVNREVRLA